jgi:hypothetical protein
MSKKASSKSKLPANNFDRWLARKGFRRNPFGRWNAEQDQDLPNYFVDIGGFDELFSLNEPCVVFARRGCGKTAQRQMLAVHSRPIEEDSPRLAVVYTYSGFERALESAGHDIEQLQPAHHVSALLYLGLAALKGVAAHDSELQSALARPEIASRLASYVSRFALHLVDDSTAHAPRPLDGFGSPELMRGFSELIQEVGLESCIVLVDGLDEFPLAAGDPARAIAFLAPLLGTLSIVECPGWAFKFFLPQGFEPTLRACGWFRVDRLHLFRITWDGCRLLDLLGQRLTHFSDRKPPYEGLGQLCEDELAQVIGDELTLLANGSPREALILGDMLLRSHCQRRRPPELIALETWEQVMQEWQARRADFVGEEKPYGARQVGTAEPMPSLALGTTDYPVLRIEERRGLVWLGGREIRNRITPQDYAVLACLYRHGSEFCSKDLIAQEAWPKGEAGGISDQAIAASIARLRRVLKALAPSVEYIETIRGKRHLGGYQLNPGGKPSRSGE